MGLRPGDSGGKSMTVSTVCLGLHYPAEVTFSTFPLVSSAEPMQGVACPLCIILERKACRINKEHNHLPTLQFDKQVPLISFWHVFGTSCFEAYPRLWGVGGVLEGCSQLWGTSRTADAVEQSALTGACVLTSVWRWAYVASWLSAGCVCTLVFCWYLSLVLNTGLFCNSGSLRSV